MSRDEERRARALAELRDLLDRVARPAMSRRQFLGRAAALGVAATTASSMWADSALAAAPKRGGRLRVGSAGASTTHSLDPATIDDTWPMLVNFGQLRNCLTEVAPDGSLVGELAESWEASPDAAVWRVKLRKGVEFHNGKSMDADDVMWSINHHRGEDSKSAAKGVVDPITDIRKDGQLTVVFELREGNADFPYIMSDYHLEIVPNGTKDGDFANGIGTGGYVLDSFDPGVRALTKRNPNYWKSGRAHFDEVETIAINDVNARTNALKTGEIDAMNRCELKTVHLLQRITGIQIWKQNGTKHYTFPMLTDVSPFDSNHVRMALKLGVDRRALLKTILRGHGSLGNDHPIAPSNRYHANELEQRKYDPDKAKWHLQQAGLSGLKVDLSSADAAFAGAVDSAVLMREHAARAGIDINVVREPNDGYWSNVWMKKAWCACYWSGRPTEDWMFSIAYAEGANWNDTNWKHDRFNRLLKLARAELDEAKRRAMYVEMQGIVRDEGGVVVPMFAADLHAASGNLEHGKRIGANWEFDGMKLAERWWFA